MNRVLSRGRSPGRRLARICVEEEKRRTKNKSLAFSFVFIVYFEAKWFEISAIQSNGRMFVFSATK